MSSDTSNIDRAICQLKQMYYDLTSEMKALKDDNNSLRKELNTFKKTYNIHKHVTPSQSFQDLPVNIVQKLTTEPNCKL